jgi:uncharacterized membrane protein YccC
VQKPASPFFAMLRRELAPTPTRLNLALRTGVACAVTLAVAFWLQSPMSSLAGVFPLMLLSPITTCTWKNMTTRIIGLIVFGCASVWIVGVLVDMPWAMLPVGFVIVTAGTVAAPLTKKPIMWMASLTVVATVMLLGTFHPDKIGWAAFNSAGALVIPIVVCTLFARLWSPQDPERTLAEQVYAAFDDSRQRLNLTLDEYCRGGELSPPDFHFTPGLAASVEAMERAAESTHANSRSLSRSQAMVTIAQRVANSVHTFQEMASSPLTDDMRVALAPHLRGLQEKLNRAIEAYATHATRGFSQDRTDLAKVRQARAGWVDFSAEIDALSATWLDVTRAFSGTSQHARVRVSFSGAIGALDELASELSLSPEQAKASTMVAHATDKEIQRAPRNLPVTRAEWSAAMKGGLATMIAFTVVLASGQIGYVTATWTALLLIQTSYGAIVRKSVLRIIGGLAGGLLAIFVMMTIYQSTTDPFAYLLFTAVICFIADYGGRSSPRISYAFQQMSMSYLVCVAALGPSANTDAPLDRMTGIMIGIAATMFCYAVLSRDYASNQLLRELAAILKPAERLVPFTGRRLLTRQEVVDIERHRIMHITAILRLVDEVVFEGKGGRVDTKVALRVGALARRVASHASGIGYVRAQTPYRAPDDRLGRALRALQVGLHAWLVQTWTLIDTTEQLGQPNSRKRRRGRSVIEALARAPLPALQPLQEELVAAHVDRGGTVREWPKEEWEALATEMIHASRLVTLLPELRQATTAMLLPCSNANEAEALAPQLAGAA